MFRNLSDHRSLKKKSILYILSLTLNLPCVFFPFSDQMDLFESANQIMSSTLCSKISNGFTSMQHGNHSAERVHQIVDHLVSLSPLLVSASCMPPWATLTIFLSPEHAFHCKTLHLKQ